MTEEALKAFLRGHVAALALTGTDDATEPAFGRRLHDAIVALMLPYLTGRAFAVTSH